MINPYSYLKKIMNKLNLYIDADGVLLGKALPNAVIYDRI